VKLLFRKRFPPIKNVDDKGSPMTPKRIAELIPTPKPKEISMPNLGDLSQCCANCPDWHALLMPEGTVATNAAGIRVGRCKAALPRMVVRSDGNVDTFPPMLEHDWCRPGRDKMNKLVAGRTLPEGTSEALPAKTYGELA
jgi:hypothetical protein